jgi:hypothetical protein
MNYYLYTQIPGAGKGWTLGGRGGGLLSFAGGYAAAAWDGDEDGDGIGCES